jgi:XRE family aerobic/anaerobic benzoate catabolism transcriptional regulator
LPTIRPSKPEKAATAPSSPANGGEFAAAVGALIRRGRAGRGVTRRQLAADSGISERYLAQIETGQGNPSVIVLQAIAQAMNLPVTELLPISGPRHEALTRIGELLARLRTTELPAIVDLLESRIRASAAAAADPCGMDAGAAREAYEPHDGAGRFSPDGGEPRRDRRSSGDS